MPPSFFDLIHRATVAAYIEDDDAVLDAVAQLDESVARRLWSALERVQEQIEAADGGADGRPWE